MTNKVKVLVAQLCPILCDPVDYSPPGSSVQWNSPGKDTGVGCRFFLQGIFPTQGSEPGPLALQADSLSSKPPGKPYMTNMLIQINTRKQSPKKHSALRSGRYSETEFEKLY